MTHIFSHFLENLTSHLRVFFLWEHVSMHRVVTLNTLGSIASIYFATQHNRFFSEPPTFFEENNVLSNLWTTLFFTRYCATFSQVKWANLQSTSVKFLHNAVCQKSLKWPYCIKSWSHCLRIINVLCGQDQCLELRNVSVLMQQLLGWCITAASDREVFNAIISYNFLYKQISFIYGSIEERCTL